MEKQNVLFLLSVFAVIGSLADCTSHTTPDGFKYDLSQILAPSQWIAAKDADGATWYYSLNVDTTLESPCPSGSSVCADFGSNGVVDKGITSSCLDLDSDVAEFGFALSYSSANGKFNTRVELVFDENATTPFMQVKTVSKSFVVITMFSDAVVPVSTSDNNGLMELGKDPTVTITNTTIDIGSISFTDHASVHVMIFTVGVFVIAFTCLCCAFRRLRSYQQKQHAMRQFSNIAFQPIPQSRIAVHKPAPVAPSFAPSFNPYVNNSQFLYYYPNRTQVAQAVPDRFVSQQEFEDQQMAIRLQAEFDQA